MSFDLDRGKISVRLSEGVYYQLIADIEDFDFTKPDGSNNANAFLNQLLPNLILYRISKREKLRKYLEDNIINCIKDNFKDKILSFMDDLFDHSYFDDNNEHYHKQTLHFRLNKQNIIRTQPFFNELEVHNQNKTTYLRNLFNEYANMRKDKRECICFDNELTNLINAVNNNHTITCTFENKNYSLIPYKIDLNYVDGSLYLLALEINKQNICHTFRLCHLRNIFINETQEYEINEKIIDKLEYLIYEYDYTNKPTINLSKIKI